MELHFQATPQECFTIWRSPLASLAVISVADIAMGNILGACVVNLEFVVGLDFLYRYGH